MQLPLWFIVNFSLAFLVCGFAMWRGGGPERLAGALFLAISIVTFLLPDRRWMDVQYTIMWLDIAYWLILVGLALLADRWWTLWMAGFQGVGVLLHLAFWAQMKITSLAYSIGLNVVGYALMVAILIGTISYIRRQSRPEMTTARTA